MFEEYPDVLTSKNIMEILSVSKECLYKLIKTKLLSCYHLGGKEVIIFTHRYTPR